MAERKEPTLSGIRPERDEIRSGAQSSAQSNAQKASRPPGAQPRQGSRPPAPRPSGSSPLAFVAIIIALLGVGVGGYGVWQMQEAKKVMQSAEVRIVELEARLNLSNSQSGQSVTQILERVDKAEEQYDLLWANYRSHRDGIAENKTAITKFDSTLKTAAADAKAAKAASDEYKSKIASLQSRASEQQLLLTRVSENNGNAEKRLQQVDQLAKQLETKVNEMAATTANNEEAIRAIDSFRRSANADIQQLKQRLGAP
ncbi:hypothetical protein [Aurantivibrio infirmus]